MHNTCAKIVQTVGKTCWCLVGACPQSIRILFTSLTYSAENRLLLPGLSGFFTHRNPHATRPFSYLFQQWFSPLSTQPITTTTNLKTKKGNN